MAIKLIRIDGGRTKQKIPQDVYQQEINNYLSGASDTANARIGAMRNIAQEDPGMVQRYFAGKAMVSPANLTAYNADTTRNAITDAAAIERDLIANGYFDNEDNVYGGNVGLTSTKYLKSSLEKAKGKLDASRAADAENKALIDQWRTKDEKNYLRSAANKTSRDNWLAIGKAEGRDYRDINYDPTDEDMLFWSNLVSGTNYDSMVDMQQKLGLDEDGYSDEWDKMVDLWYEGVNRGFALPEYDGIANPLEYVSETGLWEDRVNTMQAEADKRDLIQALEQEALSMPNYAELSVYQDKASEGTTGNAFLDFWNAPRTAYVGNYEDKSYFINNPIPEAKKTGAQEYSLAVRTYLNSGLDMLTGYEKGVYNAFVNAGETDKANRYLVAKEAELLQRRADWGDVRTSALATNPWTAVPMAAAAIGADFMSGVISPIQAIGMASGAVDSSNHSIFDTNRLSQTVQSAQSTALGEIDPLKSVDLFGKTPLQLFYSAGMGAGSNLARAATGPTSALTMAGLQAFSGGLYENADRSDMSNVAKILQPALNTLVEVGTEKIGLDALFDMSLPSAKQYVKQLVLSELGEETLAYIGNETIDQAVAYAFGHKGKYKTGEEFWQGLGDTILTTALSSLGMSAPGAVSITKSNKATGKNVKTNEAVEQVVAIAESMDKNSESYATGQQIKERMEAGKKVGVGRIGALVSAMNKELGEEYGRVISDVASGVVVDRMVELGDDVQDAKNAVGAVMKAATGGKLTDEERQSIVNSKTAIQVVEELAGGDAAEKDLRPSIIRSQAETAAEYQKKINTLTEAVQGKKSQETSAAEREAAKLIAGKKGKDTDSRVTIDSDGKAEKGKVVGFVENESGGLDVKVKTSDGEKTVSLDAVKGATGKGVATLMVMEAGEKSSSTMTAQQASEMLATYEAVGGNAAVFATEYKAAFNAGYDGEPMPPAQAISDEAAQIAYNAGKRAQTEGEAMLTRTPDATGTKTSQTGVVTFLGDVSEKAQITGQGTEELLTARMRTLSNSQKDVVQGLKAISKATGVSIVLFESTAEGRAAGVENGSFARGTNTIYLDINAGISTESGLASAKKAGTLGYAVLRTAAHELTHFIENNSKEGYAALKKAAKEEFARKGMDWSAMVDEKAKIYAERGERLDRHGAEAEVLADACEMMLQDEEAISRLAKKNPTLKDKIAGFIRNFMKRIRNALRTIGAGSKEARALMEMRDGLMQYSEELTRLWGVALEEAVENTLVEQQAMELSDVNTQFSIREEAPPKKTGIAYKVFFEKNGKLYPPMVANPGGADTPVGVWLNADVGTAAPPSKTGRLQVKAGGKGTQGGSGSLAFRPGWHLGDIPKATQFNRLNKATGVKELFPYNFVWAECEYAMDVDYQEEAMSYGYNANGKFQHSLAGLPKLPVDGYYHYRTNPDPNTVPWVITGAMKVNKILSRAEVDEILREKGVEPTKWQGPDGEQMEADSIVKQYAMRNASGNEFSITQSEIEENKRLVANAKPVVTLNGNPFAKNPNKDFKEMAHDYLGDEGIDAYNPILGNINIGMDGIEHLIAFITSRRSALLPAVKPVIEQGHIINIDKDHKAYGFDTAVIASVVSLDDRDYYMGVAVKENNDGTNGYYVHDAVLVEKKSLLPNKSGLVTAGEKAPTLAIILSDLANYNREFAGVAQKSLRDTEYLSAVESGDMETAQRMVDEAARAAGYEPIKLYHGTRNFGFTRFDTEKSDDKISLFVTDNRRIAESYSREGAGSNLKDSVKADRYDFMQQSSKDLEPYVQKHIDKNLRVPTPREIREHTDRESAFILSSMDWVTDYFVTNEKRMNRETRQALSNIMYYGGKLAAIPTAKMEDETDGYALRMKYEDAVSDLMWENREVFDEISPVIDRAVYESANKLISARFSDPFYDENIGAFVDKWKVTDRLGDKLFSGVYELYGGQSNLLVIDAKDSNWNTIDGGLIERPGVRVTTREVAEYANQHGYSGVRINNVRDGGGMTAYQGKSNVFIYFDNTSLKSADPVTYDDSGNVIPLSERFTTSNEDIRYSVRGLQEDEDASPDGSDIDASTESAYQQYSIRTWAASDYVTRREEAIDRLVITLHVDREKAAKWIDDVNSIAAIILDNKARLDYIPTAVEGVSAFKSNPEYGGSIDMSTICAKRRLATGTLDAIQRALGDAVLTKDDFLHIREMMKERKYEVACGLCFVESSRKNLSKYTKQFLDQFNATHPDNQVSMTDFNTVDGLERVRLLNQEAYGEYEKFMNKLAQRKPKLFEKRTEYRHEILQKFKKDTTVGVKNINGGLRLQSFSDFEIVHLIDMMQVITDMASVGLAGQAYTKVPEFAWALGDTGLKINLSLIAKGVDEDGNLIFDDVEGMNHEEAKRLRDAYSKNVGTIVVAFTDEQILAAMKSDFVDFIIPFHRSQWQKSDYKALGLPEGTKDYTMHQNEKHGRKRVKDNYLPNDYWKSNLSGKENAEYYLKKCAADGRTPKFAKFLQNNGDGTYALKADGSTDGYWKLLIDFKMYDNDGNFSPQNPVQPNFNMKEARLMLDTYNGIHDSFPVAQDVVDDFVAEYTGSKGGVNVNDGRVTIENIQMSLRLPDDISTREYLADADSSIAETTEQANALTIYKQRIKAYGDAVEAVERAKADLAATKDRNESIKARNRLDILQKQQSRAYDQLVAAEDTQHIRELTGKTAEFIQQSLAGKTEADIAGMIEEAESEIASLTEQLEGVKGASRGQAEATKEQIRMLKAKVTRLRNSATRKLLATRKHYQEMFQKNKDRAEVNAQADKAAKHIKAVVKRLNDRIVHESDYKNVKEVLKPAVHDLVKTFIDGFGGLVFTQKQADRLKMVYDKLAEVDSDESAFYTDDVSAMIAELAELAKEEDERKTAPAGTYSMMGNAQRKLEIYTRVADIADNIWHMVQMADEIFVDGKKRKFAELGDGAGDALMARDDYRQLYGKKGWAQEKVLEDLIRRGNMVPTYFFESLRNDEMQLLFDGIMNAQTGYSRDILAGQKAMQEAKHRYGYAKWQDQEPVHFTTKQGHSFDLTVQQMMWVYATAKREASNELAQTKHLEIGGFRFEGEQRMAEEGKGRYLRATNQPNRLTAEDVAMITGQLTDEQKAYADEMVKYLSEDAAEQGNRASMELYGIRKYNEMYYFPFRTASEQLYQKSNAGSTSTTDDARLKHASFSHRLTKGANTTLVMSDFDSVISDHINRMATYANFVSQIEAMNRVMNYKVEEDNGNLTSIRALIERKYGTSALKYIENFLKDMNGGIQSDSRATGALNKLVSAFKRGAVGASLSVAVQQPTAIAKAFAYISPKYFAKRTGVGTQAAWDELMQHSGTAVIKDMGRFDVGLGQTAAEWISKNDESELSLWERAKMYWPSAGNWTTAKTKWSGLMSALPGFMDEVTWTHIWKAVKAEQADLHPGMDTKSAAFLNMCGRRFDEIINHTQVYDSVLAKSDLMRSSNAFHRMATAFKAEPTLTANMLYDAITGKHSAGERAKIISCALVSNVLAAAFAAGISAWNDDDDDRPAAEKYLDKFSALAIDNLNPAGWLPYIADVSSLVEGYEVDRIDMSVVSDILKYGESFFGKLDNGEKISWKDYEDFVGTLANLTGIPLKNISRDARRVWNAFTSNTDSTMASNIKYTVLENLPYGLYPDTKNAYYQRYVSAATSGNAQKAYNIKDFMTSSKGTSEDAWAQGVRKVLKSMVSSGEMTAEEAKQFMLDNGLAKDQKAAYQYVDKWTEGDDGYSVYNTARDAVKSGNSTALADEVKNLTQNGYEEKTVFSEVRGLIKTEYMNGSISKNQAKSMYNAYVSEDFDAKDTNEWYWLFREWDYGAKNNGSTDGYSKYGTFVEAVKTGKNLKTVISEYTSHGVEAKTLSAQITTAFKDEFVTLYKTNKTQAANLLARLLTAYEALGFDRGKKQRDIMKWPES